MTLGLLSSLKMTGKSLIMIFAGLKQSQLSSWSTSLSNWASKMPICTSTQTTKALLGLLPKVEARTAQLILPFAVLWLHFTLFLFLLISPIFLLQKIWLTQSCVGILALWIKFCFLLSCSLMSLNPSSFMSSLNPSFSVVTHAIASLVEGGHKMLSPHPTYAHNSSLVPSSSDKPPLPFSLHTSSDVLPCYHNIFFTSHKGRKPTQGREIKTSDLRPLVPAKECLFFWQTPYGEDHFFDMAKKLPLPLASMACLTIRSALLPTTATTYAAGMKRFTQFCDHWDIPECDHMPASYALLSTFIASYIGKKAGKTIKTWLSRIYAWHTINHAPWYDNDKWVHLCHTIANRAGTFHEKPPHAPVSLNYLHML